VFYGGANIWREKTAASRLELEERPPKLRSQGRLNLATLYSAGWPQPNERIGRTLTVVCTIGSTSRTRMRNAKRCLALRFGSPVPACGVDSILRVGGKLTVAHERLGQCWKSADKGYRRSKRDYEPEPGRQPLTSFFHGPQSLGPAKRLRILLDLSELNA